MVCGVYRITCKVTSRSYIGSSVNIFKRWSWHSFILRANSPMIGYGLTRPHPCQEEFNLYGMDEFEVVVIEKCDRSELLAREQYWMDHPDYIDRYNYDVKASGSKIASLQTRQWMSEAAIKRNARPEYNKMISERAKKQHEEGRLGWSTRKPVLTKQPSEEQLNTLKEWLDVDCKEGLIWWSKSNRNGKIVKDESVGHGGGLRTVFYLNKKTYSTDEVIWFFNYGEWPMYKLDHIDGDFRNDEISNLRLTKGEGKTRSKYQGV